jgi:hypothetical protein
LVLALAALPAACGGSPAETNLPEPDYAGEIAENMLISLNNGDYDSFTRDFDNTMKDAVTQEVFDTQFIQNIRGIIGNYEPGSKQFFQAASQAQYTIVFYFAEYTEESGAVLVRVTFQQIEGRPYIAGLLWNSPKLRG